MGALRHLLIYTLGALKTMLFSTDQRELNAPVRSSRQRNRADARNLATLFPPRVFGQTFLGDAKRSKYTYYPLPMGRRAPIDFPLRFRSIPVVFADGQKSTARCEGNNAAWHCRCREQLPLLGRCYYQFNDTCYTVCPRCRRRYRVIEGRGKRAVRVIEI